MHVDVASPLPATASAAPTAFMQERPEQPAASASGPVPTLRDRLTERLQRQLPFPVALAVLVVVVGFLAIMMHSFHVPADPGIDQNAYLTEARYMLHGKLWSRPATGWQWAGGMLVLTPDGRIAGKYPLGYPLLLTVARLLGGASAVYWVPPICMILAIGLSFFLFRKFLGDFLGLLAVLALAFNPITMGYINQLMSHAAALFFTVAGFLMLVEFWQKGTVWRAALAGFLLAYSSTVRYTDFLSCIPLAYVLFVPFGQRRSTWKERIAAAVGFAIPLGAMGMANWACFGAPWRTGYALSDEQTAFAWKYFWGHGFHQGNWLTMLRQFDGYGLLLLFPLALLGMLRMFWDSKKNAAFLALWVLPGTFLYLAYYWAPAMPQTTMYLRFFLDFCPALIIFAYWFIARSATGKPWAMITMAGVATALATGVSAHSAGPSLLRAAQTKRQYAIAERTVRHDLPAGSLVFSNGQMLNQIGSIGGYALFDTGLFNGGRRMMMFHFGGRHKKGPSPFQHARVIAMRHLVDRKNSRGHWVPRSRAALRRDEVSLIQTALKQHRQVAFLVTGARRTVPRVPGTTVTKLAAWNMGNGMWFHGRRGRFFRRMMLRRQKIMARRQAAAAARAAARKRRAAHAGGHGGGGMGGGGGMLGGFGLRAMMGPPRGFGAPGGKANGRKGRQARARRSHRWHGRFGHGGPPWMRHFGQTRQWKLYVIRPQVKHPKALAPPAKKVALAPPARP